MELKEVLCPYCGKPMTIQPSAYPGPGANTSLSILVRTPSLSASKGVSGRIIVFYCESCFNTVIIEE